MYFAVAKPLLTNVFRLFIRLLMCLGYAAEYARQIEREEAELAPLSFVERSDYAVLNAEGQVEAHGSGQEQFKEHLDDLVRAQEQASALLEVSTRRSDQSDENEKDEDVFLDLGNGPTTLMLFNIFTPDEVDFLSELVGQDVVQELKEEVKEEEKEEEEEQSKVGVITTTTEKSLEADTNGEDKEEKEPYKMRETLEKYSPLSRPPKKDTKNVLASSQGPDRLVSSSQESPEDDADLEEEAFFRSTVRSRTTPRSSFPTARPTGQTYVTAKSFQGPLIPMGSANSKAEDRHRKMEELLDRLSDRYNKRAKEEHQNPIKAKGNNDEVAKTERMKVMIENLKKKLEKTRPGVSRLSLSDLSEQRYASTSSHPATTVKSVPLNAVEKVLGEKLREMSVGVHRLNLDDILDLDRVKVAGPTGPPGHQLYELKSRDKNLPKRQVHPKLTYQRPQPSIAHLPSINLKSRITPVPDLPDSQSLKYNKRPIIPRYSDVTVPPGNYHKDSYMSRHFRTTPSVTVLNPSTKSDPHPETKELPPYHNPSPQYTSVLEPTEPTPKYLKLTGQYGHDVPSPPSSPSKFLRGDVGGISQQHPKYVSSNSYRDRPENYAPPKKAYLPPPSPAKNSREKAGRHFDGVLAKFPPPSSRYKQPSIQFDKHGHPSDPIAVTPKNSPANKNPVGPEVKEEVRSLGRSPKQSDLAGKRGSSYSYYHDDHTSYVSSTQGPVHFQTHNEHGSPRVFKKLSPAHYKACPKIPPKPENVCKHYTVHTCWSPGVRDLDCPLSGLCCFDGCVNTCLPPDYGEKDHPVMEQSEFFTTVKPTHNRLQSTTIKPPEPTSVRTLSRPTKSHVPPNHYRSTIHPPAKSYLHPEKNHYRTTPRPDDCSTPFAHYVSTLKPKGESNLRNKPKYVSTLKPKETYMSTMRPPVKEYLPPSGRHMSTMKPPTNDFVPPKETYGSSIIPPVQEYALPEKTYLSTMKPPESDHWPHNDHAYIRPERPPVNKEAYMSSMKPPQKEYAPPSHYMSTLKPPKKSYLPPESHYMSTLRPPAQGYGRPANSYVSTLEPSRKPYLPPDNSYMSVMKPPVQEYLPPGELYMSTIKPPRQEYIPPKAESLPPREHYVVSTAVPPENDFRYMSTIQPPNQGYLPPEESYVSSLKPPSKAKLVPDEYDVSTKRPSFVTAMRPPVVDYVPPHYVSTIQPPRKEYLPPKEEHISTTYAPAEIHLKVPVEEYAPPKGKYLGTMKTPSKFYVPPEKGSYQASTTMKPPSLNYEPPVSYPHREVDSMTRYQPPSSEYLPPSSEYLPPHHEMAKMVPPHHEYLPPEPDHTQYESPPHKNASYAEKDHKLSLAHYKSCPLVSEKPQQVCKDYTQHTCWSPGVRDPDCPLSGLCCFDGCVNTCLPPNYKHDPNIEYTEGDLSAAKKAGALAKKQKPPYPLNEESQYVEGVDYALASCPVKEKRTNCKEHNSHQCWSPGVPDLDCPGSGLCCFDGCVNVCIMGHHEAHNSNQYHLHHHHHHHHVHPISYHRPPHTKYLVPSSLFIPHDAIHGTDEEGGVVAQKNGHGYEQRPPYYGLEDIYSLGELDSMKPDKATVVDHSTIHTAGHAYPAVTLSPPARYVLPAKDYIPPLPEYVMPSYMELKPPHRAYLPPKAHPDLQNDFEAMTHFQLPSQAYLPPASGSSSSTRHYYSRPKSLFSPPSKTYLPPPRTGASRPIYEVRTVEEVVSSAYEDSTPNNRYYAPQLSASNDHNDPDAYHSPSQQYLPPHSHAIENPVTAEAFGTEEPSARHGASYKSATAHLLPSPEELKMSFEPEYLPPEGKSAGVMDTHFTPPSRKYLPPGDSSANESNPDHDNFELPAQQYLPPKEDKPQVDVPVQAHHIPSSTPYTPPRHEKEPHDQYQLPRKEYIPPPHEKTHKPKVSYELPSEEYLPPETSKSLESHFQAPSKEYLPPPAAMGKSGKLSEHYKPPTKTYLPPKNSLKEHYEPPTDAYLPPKNYLQKHYEPPSKDYLPPAKGHDKKEELDVDYAPPSKEYLPPSKVEAENDVKPEPQVYLPPPTNHHGQAVQPHPQAPSQKDPGLLPGVVSGSHLKPPDKAYLPPKHDEFRPPFKEYLPPTKVVDHHKPLAHAPAKTKGPATEYELPQEEYLPPPPPPPHDDLSHYHPPHKDYLPPSDSAKDKLPHPFEPPTEPHFGPPEPHASDHHPEKPHLGQYQPKVNEHYVPPGGNQYQPPSGYLPPSAPHIVVNGKDLPINIQISIPHEHELKFQKNVVKLPPVLPSYIPPPKRPDDPPDYAPGYEPPTEDYGPPLIPEYHPASHIGAEKHVTAIHNDLVHDVHEPENFSLPKSEYIPPNLLPKPGKTLSAPKADDFPVEGEKPKLTYLPPPPRGPQFPTKEYLPPPPRPQIPPEIPEPPPPEALPNVLNSQVAPPALVKEHYIPPKTKNDVPRNFVSPDDIVTVTAVETENKLLVPEPPPPEDIPIDIDPDAEAIVPTAFLGLAKLRDEDVEDDKVLQKLIEEDEGAGLPRLPPMPTEAPSAAEFLPLLEEVDPDLVNALRGVARQRDRKGWIPGVPGKDYPDFKVIPPTDFSCGNFILEGFYADTFTSCQASVFSCSKHISLLT